MREGIERLPTERHHCPRDVFWGVGEEVTVVENVVDAGRAYRRMAVTDEPLNPRNEVAVGDARKSTVKVAVIPVASGGKPAGNGVLNGTPS